jgi:murein DD-endopeptidase MepM/ murein hydrolase activator NlpD
VAYNANFLDYGGTLVLEHPGGWYSLYGHLERAVASRWQPGTPIQAGQELALLGSPDENGGWEPHLHLQCMLDMGQHYGDFPGVCLPEELTQYRALCPDPYPLLGIH